MSQLRGARRPVVIQYESALGSMIMNVGYMVVYSYDIVKWHVLLCVYSLVTIAHFSAAIMYICASTVHPAGAHIGGAPAPIAAAPQPAQPARPAVQVRSIGVQTVLNVEVGTCTLCANCIAS